MTTPTATDTTPPKPAAMPEIRWDDRSYGYLGDAEVAYTSSDGDWDFYLTGTNGKAPTRDAARAEVERRFAEWWGQGRLRGEWRGRKARDYFVNGIEVGWVSQVIDNRWRGEVATEDDNAREFSSESAARCYVESRIAELMGMPVEGSGEAEEDKDSDYERGHRDGQRFAEGYWGIRDSNGKHRPGSWVSAPAPEPTPEKPAVDRPAWAPPDATHGRVTDGHVTHVYRQHGELFWWWQPGGISDIGSTTWAHLIENALVHPLTPEPTPEGPVEPVTRYRWNPMPTHPYRYLHDAKGDWWRINLSEPEPHLPQRLIRKVFDYYLADGRLVSDPLEKPRDGLTPDAKREIEQAQLQLDDKEEDMPEKTPLIESVQSRLNELKRRYNTLRVRIVNDLNDTDDHAVAEEKMKLLNELMLGLKLTVTGIEEFIQRWDKNLTNIHAEVFPDVAAEEGPKEARDAE